MSYLIKAYGLDNFKKFYINLNENFEQCFKESFGIRLSEIEKGFTDYISLLVPNKEILKLTSNFLA